MRDWSSDVCSSDLRAGGAERLQAGMAVARVVLEAVRRALAHRRGHAIDGRPGTAVDEAQERLAAGGDALQHRLRDADVLLEPGDPMRRVQVDRKSTRLNSSH